MACLGTCGLISSPWADLLKFKINWTALIVLSISLLMLIQYIDSCDGCIFSIPMWLLCSQSNACWSSWWILWNRTCDELGLAFIQPQLGLHQVWGRDEIQLNSISPSDLMKSNCGWMKASLNSTKVLFQRIYQLLHNTTEWEIYIISNACC